MTVSGAVRDGALVVAELTLLALPARMALALAPGVVTSAVAQNGTVIWRKKVHFLQHK